MDLQHCIGWIPSGRHIWISCWKKYLDHLSWHPIFFKNVQKGIQRTQKFLNRFGPYTVVIGRFIPAIRPLVPFLLGITDLELKRFYIADIIACFAWACALALLVVSVAPIFT